NTRMKGTCPRTALLLIVLGVKGRLNFSCAIFKRILLGNICTRSVIVSFAFYAHVVSSSRALTTESHYCSYHSIVIHRCTRLWISLNQSSNYRRGNVLLRYLTVAGICQQNNDEKHGFSIP